MVVKLIPNHSWYLFHFAQPLLRDSRFNPSSKRCLPTSRASKPSPAGPLLPLWPSGSTPAPQARAAANCQCCRAGVPGAAASDPCRISAACAQLRHTWTTRGGTVQAGPAPAAGAGAPAAAGVAGRVAVEAAAAAGAAGPPGPCPQGRTRPTARPAAAAAASRSSAARSQPQKRTPPAGHGTGMAGLQWAEKLSAMVTRRGKHQVQQSITSPGCIMHISCEWPLQHALLHKPILA